MSSGEFSPGVVIYPADHARESGTLGRDQSNWRLLVQPVLTGNVRTTASSYVSGGPMLPTRPSAGAEGCRGEGLVAALFDGEHLVCVCLAAFPELNRDSDARGCGR